MDLGLFTQKKFNKEFVPLAERVRPHGLDGFIGQEHLLSRGKALRQAIENDRLYSLIFWGPPGSGKTTLARIIANQTKSDFIPLSAVSAGIKDIKEAAKKAEESLTLYKRRTILFIDEIHRFNRTQQDALLPYVENGVLVLIGATTENPSFEVNSPLLSRVRVLVLNRLAPEEIEKIIIHTLQDQENGLGDLALEIDKNSLKFLSQASNGDARVALNALEVSSFLLKRAKKRKITAPLIEEALQKKNLYYDKGAEEHYNLISAFIKSLRGSDPDGAIYWLARMIEVGEDPLFIARRMVIFASEDIGNADPRALQVAVAAMQATDMVGLPEARINLSQAATYLSSSPKSNASYMAYNFALEDVKEYGNLDTPFHIRNAPTPLMKDLGYGKGYKYAHNYKGNIVFQQNLPDKLKDKKYYQPTENGYEKMIKERLKFWETIKKKE